MFLCKTYEIDWIVTITSECDYRIYHRCLECQYKRMFVIYEILFFILLSVLHFSCLFRIWFLIQFFFNLFF